MTSQRRTIRECKDTYKVAGMPLMSWSKLPCPEKFRRLNIQPPLSRQILRQVFPLDAKDPNQPCQAFARRKLRQCLQKQKSNVLSPTRERKMTPLLELMTEWKLLHGSPKDVQLHYLSSLSIPELSRLAQVNKPTYAEIASLIPDVAVEVGQRNGIPLEDALCDLIFAGGYTCPQPWKDRKFISHNLSQCKPFCANQGLASLRHTLDMVFWTEWMVQNALKDVNKLEIRASRNEFQNQQAESKGSLKTEEEQEEEERSSFDWRLSNIPDITLSVNNTHVLKANIRQMQQEGTASALAEFQVMVQQFVKVLTHLQIRSILWIIGLNDKEEESDEAEEVSTVYVRLPGPRALFPHEPIILPMLLVFQYPSTSMLDVPIELEYETYFGSHKLTH